MVIKIGGVKQMVLNLMIGQASFPMTSIGGVGVIEIFKEVVPYFFILVGVLLLITYVPAITLFLPELFFDR